MYDLVAYDVDTFYWSADHDGEVCNRSMFPSLWTDVHKCTFGKGNDGLLIA